MGPADTIPYIGGRLAPGTWRQLVFIENDNRPRNRECFIMLVGEQG